MPDTSPPTTDGSTPIWGRLASPNEIAAALVDLYRRRGGDAYDEVVSQTDHALQCASLATASGADDHTVVAAFCHDIGHLLLGEDDGGSPIVDLRHQDVAERFLARWFDERVTAPVAGHVDAKRYLVAVDPGYHDTLSPASVRSLELQGGPMDTAERAAFESRPGWETAVQLRRWDDLAKVAGAPTPGLDHFETVIVDVLAGDPR